MTDDKVEAWLKEFKSDFVFIDAGICKLSEAALDELLALVRVYREANQDVCAWDEGEKVDGTFDCPFHAVWARKAEEKVKEIIGG